MYLHIGSDMMLQTDSIIGIFDVSTVKTFFPPTANKYSSGILTDKGLFFSEISSLTLKKRAEVIFTHEQP